MKVDAPANIPIPKSRMTEDTMTRTATHIFFESDREPRIDLTSLADNPCPIRSSITERRCLLPEGHAPWRPDRFHRFLQAVSR